MEFSESETVCDLRLKWRTSIESVQEYRPLHALPLHSLSDLKREAQKKFRQQLNQELKNVRKDRENSQNSLNSLRAQLKNLKIQLENLTSELQRMQNERSRLENLKKDFMAEIKNKYTAFLLAKNFYKTKLNIYYSLRESQNSDDPDEKEISLEFFKHIKSTNRNYFVELRKKNDIYSLIDMKPMLPNFEKLSLRLEETNDIQGFLSCVRCCFQKLHSKNIS